MLFGDNGTYCFARNTSRDYEKEKLSSFFKEFLRQSQPRSSKPEPKNVENTTFLAQLCRHPIGWYI